MNYKESTLSGSQWQRCNRVTIDNPYNSTPQITMHEEVITLVGDKQFQQNAGAVYTAFNPDADIDLLDFETGAPLGQTIKQGVLHLAMWSLYMALAQARDEKVPDDGPLPA